jgi:hypothetical protein
MTGLELFYLCKLLSVPCLTPGSFHCSPCIGALLAGYFLGPFVAVAAFNIAILGVLVLSTLLTLVSVLALGGLFYPLCIFCACAVIS